MNILVDMNLTPRWCEVLQAQGWPTVHWSDVGDARASDASIMTWALTNGHVVFTHDLDFGAILVATQWHSPSVIQVRTQNVMPSYLGDILIPVLRQL